MKILANFMSATIGALVVLLITALWQHNGLAIMYETIGLVIFSIGRVCVYEDTGE